MSNLRIDREQAVYDEEEILPLRLEHKLPRAGVDGFFELDGVRYGTEHAWETLLEITDIRVPEIGIDGFDSGNCLRRGGFYSKAQMEALYPERFREDIPHAGADGFFELDGVRYGTEYAWGKILGLTKPNTPDHGIDGFDALNRFSSGGFYSKAQMEALYPERFRKDIPHAGADGFFELDGVRYGTEHAWGKTLGFTEANIPDHGIDGYDARNIFHSKGFYSELQMRNLYPERFREDIPRAGADGFFFQNGERYAGKASWKTYLSWRQFDSLSGGLDAFNIQNKLNKGGFYRKQQLILAYPHLFQKHVEALLSSFEVRDFSDWLDSLRHFYDFLELGPVDRPYPLVLVNLFLEWSQGFAGRFPGIKRYIELIERKPRQIEQSNREGHSPECVYLAQKDLELWMEQSQSAANGSSGDLISRAQSGDRMAEDAVVRQYERLVENLAFKYKGALALEDAMQEGRIGLMTALKKYDPAKGSFENHARWWIRSAITLAVKNTSRDVRLSGSILEESRNIGRVISEALKKDGCKPSGEELVRRTGLTHERIKAVMEAFNAGVVSLDAPVGDADGRPFHEVLADSKVSVDPVEEADFEAFLSRAWELMDSHKYGEYWPIFLNAMGYRDEPESFQVVADRLGITREAVRQRAFRALEVVLDDPACSQFLLEVGVSEEALEAKFEQIDKALNRGKKRK